MNQEEIPSSLEQPILVDSQLEHGELNIPHQHSYAELFFHYWHRIALILLIIHGLVGLFESLQFVIFEYIELSENLTTHTLGEHQINELLAAAVVTFGTTAVNIFFAIRLSKVKETTAHNIDLVVSTILIIASRHLQTYLISLDLLNLVLSYT